MSRMLQALKNLEARSVRPAAPLGRLAHLADRPRTARAVAPPASVEVEDLTTPAMISPAPTLIVEPEYSSLASVAHPVSMDSFFVAESFAPTLSLPVVEAAAEAPPAAIPEPIETPARTASALERTVRRTLADPQRSEAYRQIAARISSQAAELNARSLVLVGVGTQSDTHELLLHVAAVLADEGREVLLIDTDLSSRRLSAALDFPDGRGLAEILVDELPPHSLIQPTAIVGVSVLPGGKRSLNLDGRANRLSSLIDDLESKSRLILIDGGRASDPAALAVARLAGGAYFVVRLGATDAGEAQAALRQFRQSPARVLGCIATS